MIGHHPAGDRPQGVFGGGGPLPVPDLLRPQEQAWASAADMMRHFKDSTTPIGSKAKQENPELIERGIFVQKDTPEYCQEYDKIIERR
jgi:hypothetical protein